MKTITINFNFTDEQYEEVAKEAESIDMGAGEMLTKVMKIIVKDMLDTRKNRIHKSGESPE